MSERISDERLEEIADEVWGDEQRTEESVMATELLTLRADAETSQRHNDDVMSPLFDQLEQAGYTGTWSQKVAQVCELKERQNQCVDAWWNAGAAQKLEGGA